MGLNAGFAATWTVPTEGPEHHLPEETAGPRCCPTHCVTFSMWAPHLMLLKGPPSSGVFRAPPPPNEPSLAGPCGGGDGRHSPQSKDPAQQAWGCREKDTGCRQYIRRGTSLQEFAHEPHAWHVRPLTFGLSKFHLTNTW